MNSMRQKVSFRDSCPRILGQEPINLTTRNTVNHVIDIRDITVTPPNEDDMYGHSAQDIPSV